MHHPDTIYRILNVTYFVYLSLNFFGQLIDWTYLKWILYTYTALYLVSKYFF